MLLEGRIETTNLHEIIAPQVSFGLDTAEKRRLLDQRNAFQTKCQVARLSFDSGIRLSTLLPPGEFGTVSDYLNEWRL